MNQNNVDAIVRQQYLAFASFPLTSDQERTEAFRSIMTNPYVTRVGFMRNRSHIMLIETVPVHIEYNTETYRIGRFVIMIRRELVDRSWQIEYWFNNQDLIIERPGCSSLHHPHIIDSPTDQFEFPVGKLCIQTGHDELIHVLKQGNIPAALPLFWHILTLYPSGYPYMPVEDGWPIVERTR